MEIRRTLIAGALAGIGASLCCVAPLVLATLGVGGAWVSALTKVEPLRPLLAVLAVGSLALAWRTLYRTERRCEVGTACPDDHVLRRQRLLFWLVALPVLALLVFPWFAPFLL